MKEAPLLQVNNLCCGFRQGRQILRAIDGISFEIARGECLGIVGESGCGKSVTAQSIMRLLPQPVGVIESGEILFRGEDILLMKRQQLHAIRGAEIGMIFQEPMLALNPVQRIGAQIMESLSLHSELKREEQEKRALELLLEVRMPDAQNCMQSLPHKLSGGMRQRALIAIAIASQPSLIIADEPTTALDVTVQQQILKLLHEQRIKLNAATLLISHDLGVIAQNCQRVIVMYAGRIVESAPVERLFEQPRHAYTRALFAAIPRGDIPHKSILPCIPNHVAPLNELVEGCRFCQRLGRDKEELHQRPKLIEIAPEHWVENCPRCMMDCP